jgi:hypothetical protein
MTLLLDRCGVEVKIITEVIKAAARNRSQGKKVMALLLNQRGDRIFIIS